MKTAIFSKIEKIANIVRSAKNYKIRRVNEILQKKGLRGPPQELRFLQKTAKIANIVKAAKNC